MRHTLLTFLLIGVASWAYPQALSLTYQGEDVSNSEIAVQGHPSDEFIKVNLAVTNNSESTIMIKVRRRVTQNIDGTFNSICLGTCLEPSVDETIDPYSLEAGATTDENEFYVQFYPEGNVGTARIEYIIFDVDNPEENLTLAIEFVISPTGIDAITTSPALIVSGLVPQHGILRAGFNLSSNQNARIIVTNILGVRYIENHLQEKSGTLNIPVGNMPKGIYICSLVSGGRLVSAKKFVVN